MSEVDRVHALLNSTTGGERSRICAAVSRSRITIGPAQCGHCQVAEPALSELARACDPESRAGVGSKWRQIGKSLERLRVARNPKWRMRTKPLGST
jgi:hypothetical protein